MKLLSVSLCYFWLPSFFIKIISILIPSSTEKKNNNETKTDRLSPLCVLSMVWQWTDERLTDTDSASSVLKSGHCLFGGKYVHIIINTYKHVNS